MRRDYKIVPMIPVELAQKKATLRTSKAIFLGGIIGIVLTGYWPVALLLIPVSFVVNKVVKKVLEL